MKHTSPLLKQLCLGLLASASLWSASVWAQAQSFTLGNGMTLIVKPDRRAPTVAHMVWVRADRA
jgi:zinc protease